MAKRTIKVLKLCSHQKIPYFPLFCLIPFPKSIHPLFPFQIALSFPSRLFLLFPSQKAPTAFWPHKSLEDRQIFLHSVATQFPFPFSILNNLLLHFLHRKMSSKTKTLPPLKLAPAIFLLFLHLSNNELFGQASRNAPPALLPLEGQQSPIRIAVGTRGFKLSCPVRVDSVEEEGEDELIIKWTKDGQQISGISQQENEEEEDENDDGRNGWRLANRNRDLRLRIAHPKDSGLYKCTAINEWGHRSVEFRLEVLDPKALSERGIQLAQSASAPAWKEALGPQPLSIRIHAGQTLQLNCPAALANPLPQLQWIRHGQHEQELGITSPLSLPHIRPQDAGIYTCRLQNALGSIRADFSVQVTEQFGEDGSDEDAILLHPSGNLSPGSAPPHSVLPPPPPPRIEQPQAQMLKAGNTAQLQCRVEWRGEGDKAVIRWLRQIENAELMRAKMPNATLLRLGEISLLMLDQGGNDAVRLEIDEHGQRHFLNELRIQNVRKEDSGRYFCVVTNPAGQFVYRSALLSVLDPPPNKFPVPFSAASPLVRFLLLSSIGLLLCCLPLLCWLCLARRCRSRLMRQQNERMGKCQPKNNTTSSSANNTFASSTSSYSSSSNSGTKQPLLLISSIAAGGPQQQQLPPPPRVPPPPNPWPTAHHPPFHYQSATLDRHPPQQQQQQRPQILHRTTNRAEDEMSRISSHIYASGSPLPPVSHNHHSFHPIQISSQIPASFLPNPQQSNSSANQQIPRLPGQIASSSAQLPANPLLMRRGEGMGRRILLGDDQQKMPLIEAQRKSAELWRGD